MDIWKELTIHSSTIAWKIPWTEEPGRLQSMGSQRVGHDWVTSLTLTHVWMWDLDHKEGRAPKNWCFPTVVLEKTFESPLDSKEIKPVNLKGNQHWILIGRTDAEALILWSPDVKRRLIGKDPDAGKDWRQEEKGTTEDEMVEWHHWFNGHELGQTLGDGEGQGTLVCCSLWGLKKSETTWLLNNNNDKES